MNEQVLQAIVKLLIASIKIDGLAEGERKTFEHFLRENLKGPALRKYLHEFDHLIETTPADIEFAIEDLPQHQPRTEPQAENHCPAPPCRNRLRRRRTYLEGRSILQTHQQGVFY